MTDDQTMITFCKQRLNQIKSEGWSENYEAGMGAAYYEMLEFLEPTIINTVRMKIDDK